MTEIRIKPHPKFFGRKTLTERTAHNARWLAERLAMLIEGDNQVERIDHDVLRWQLGKNNDWRMHYDRETKEFVIWYRYAGPHCAAELAALRTVIIWRLGWEEQNRTPAPTA